MFKSKRRIKNLLASHMECHMKAQDLHYRLERLEKMHNLSSVTPNNGMNEMQKRSLYNEVNLSIYD